MRGKTSLVVVARILGWGNSYILGFQPRNYLGKAAVLLLLVISISSSTLGVTRFSKVVESGGVVNPVRLGSRVLMVSLGRETTVRGGIHTCHWISRGEPGEALGGKVEKPPTLRCYNIRVSTIPIMTIICFILEDQPADFNLLWKSLAATKDSQKGG